MTWLLESLASRARSVTPPSGADSSPPPPPPLPRPTPPPPPPPPPPPTAPTPRPSFGGRQRSSAWSVAAGGTVAGSVAPATWPWSDAVAATSLGSACDGPPPAAAPETQASQAGGPEERDAPACASCAAGHAGATAEGMRQSALADGRSPPLSRPLKCERPSDAWERQLPVVSLPLPSGSSEGPQPTPSAGTAAAAAAFDVELRVRLRVAEAQAAGLPFAGAQDGAQAGPPLASTFPYLASTEPTSSVRLRAWRCKPLTSPRQENTIGASGTASPRALAHAACRRQRSATVEPSPAVGEGEADEDEAGAAAAGGPSAPPLPPTPSRALPPTALPWTATQTSTCSSSSKAGAPRARHGAVGVPTAASATGSARRPADTRLPGAGSSTVSSALHSSIRPAWRLAESFTSAVISAPNDRAHPTAHARRRDPRKDPGAASQPGGARGARRPDCGGEGSSAVEEAAAGGVGHSTRVRPEAHVPPPSPRYGPGGGGEAGGHAGGPSGESPSTMHSGNPDCSRLQGSLTPRQNSPPKLFLPGVVHGQQRGDFEHLSRTRTRTSLWPLTCLT